MPPEIPCDTPPSTPFSTPPTTPADEDALAFASRHIPDGTPTLLVSPVSSHRKRNWRPERYAAVMDHAALKLGWQVVLCGGPDAFEREFGEIAVRRRAGGPGLPLRRHYRPRAAALRPHNAQWCTHVVIPSPVTN